MERFEPLLGHDIMAEVTRRAQSLNTRLAGRVVWNVNSTASGGGVAEMLSSLLGYPRSMRVDVRWAVIEGTPEFFTVTKRIHHALQGSPGDGSPLGDEQHAIYELVSQENADELRRLITPGDVVILTIRKPQVSRPRSSNTDAPWSGGVTSATIRPMWSPSSDGLSCLDIWLTSR